MVRSLVIPVLLVLALLSAVPTAVGQGGLYQSHAQVELLEVQHEITPTQTHRVGMRITMHCGIAASGVNPDHLLGPEPIFFSVRSDLVGLEVELAQSQTELHRQPRDCVEGRTHTLRNSIMYRLTDDLEAWTAGSVTVHVDPEWGREAVSVFRVRVGVAGSLELEAPEQVTLDEAGEASVALRLVNHYNAPIMVEPQITLRGLIGAQPAVEPLVLASGETRNVTFPVRVEDDPHRTGSLRVVLWNAPHDDPARAFPPVTTTIMVGSPSDDPALLNVAVEESPAPPFAGLVALLGLVLAVRASPLRSRRA